MLVFSQMKQTSFFTFSISLLFLLISNNTQAQSISLNQDRQSPDYGLLEVSNLSGKLFYILQTQKLTKTDWKKIFPVYTKGERPDTLDKPNIIGSYFIKNKTLYFKPRFFWVDDLEYRTELRLAPLAALAKQGNIDTQTVIAHIFSLDPIQTPPTLVTKVYPGASKLPANILKMYIYFSAPMSRRQSKKFVKIIDKNGTIVSNVFLPIRQELWNNNRTRLTLFFDPGRIKRGLRPHREQGNPLQPNQQYQLVIDKQWKDAYGKALKTGFSKEFSTIAADRTQPAPAKWSVQTPETSTTKPLKIRTLQSLDHALVQRYLQITDAKGNDIAGTLKTSANEQVIHFTPAKNWQPGKYTLNIDTRLEDLAGNNIRQLFDVDMQQKKTDKKVAKVFRLHFKVGKAANN